MTKDLNLEAVNGALGREVRQLQEELKAADKANATITARVKQLEEALTDVLSWAEEIAGDTRDHLMAEIERSSIEKARALLTPAPATGEPKDE